MCMLVTWYKKVCLVLPCNQTVRSLTPGGTGWRSLSSLTFSQETASHAPRTIRWATPPAHLPTFFVGTQKMSLPLHYILHTDSDLRPQKTPGLKSENGGKLNIQLTHSPYWC